MAAVGRAVCVSVAARINGVVMMWTHHRAGTASLQILPEKHIQPRKELQAYRQEGSRLHNSDSSGMGTKRQKRKDWHDPREHPFVSRPLITQQAALHAAAPHRREKRCPNRYSPLMQNIFYTSPFQKLAASLSRSARCRAHIRSLVTASALDSPPCSDAPQHELVQAHAHHPRGQRPLAQAHYRRAG